MSYGTVKKTSSSDLPFYNAFLQELFLRI
jgi:hypothetical protein